ncbi:MAG: hypothetical protein EHM52_02500 [Actinomycetota bacterium]|nr:MAG: hypothetical protein EHM52_02500 [Actinomycetota bacterium]
MATIGETIDLAIPLETARSRWAEYVTGMVIGSGKGPGEQEHPFRWRKSEQEAEEGVVQFVTVADDVTRLTVALDFPDLDADDREAASEIDRLRGFLQYDLELFREFAEGRLRIGD